LAVLVFYFGSPVFYPVFHAFSSRVCHEVWFWEYLPGLSVLFGFGDDEVAVVKEDIPCFLYEEFAGSPSDEKTVDEDILDECVFVEVFGVVVLNYFVGGVREWDNLYFGFGWAGWDVSPEVCVDAECFGEGFDGFPFVDDLVFSSYVLVLLVFFVFKIRDALKGVKVEPVDGKDVVCCHVSGVAESVVDGFFVFSVFEDPPVFDGVEEFFLGVVLCWVDDIGVFDFFNI